MKKLLFTGTSTAIVTPMADGEVNYTRFEKLIEMQYHAGVRCLTVTGTTGECATLSEREKRNLWRCAVENAPKDMTVIAGCGTNDTKHTKRFCRIAEKTGVDGVLVVTPYYNKTTQNGLLEHYSAVSAATSLPLIVYNVPGRTGLDCTFETYEKLSRNDTIIGVKEASGNIAKAEKILKYLKDDFYVWSGNDDQIVPLMSVGAKGVISVFSNLCPTETVSMTNACLSHNFEKAGMLQCDYADLIELLFCEVNPIPIKTAMNKMGWDVGDVRLPLCKMFEANKEKLVASMRAHKLIV